MEAERRPTQDSPRSHSSHDSMVSARDPPTDGRNRTESVSCRGGPVLKPRRECDSGVPHCHTHVTGTPRAWGVRGRDPSQDDVTSA